MNTAAWIVVVAAVMGLSFALGCWWEIRSTKRDLKKGTLDFMDSYEVERKKS